MEIFVPVSVLDSSCWRRTLSMLSLLLISLQGYRIISFDVVNKFQTLLQICRVMILLDFTFLLNGLSHSICLHQWIIFFLCPLTVIAHLLFTCANSDSSRYKCWDTVRTHPLLCSANARWGLIRWHWYLQVDFPPSYWLDNDLLPSSLTQNMLCHNTWYHLVSVFPTCCFLGYGIDMSAGTHTHAPGADGESGVWSVWFQ